MPVSDDVPYLSRFVTKFFEIIAAGLATAVSGYLIAHLSGVLSSPAPAPTPAAAIIGVDPSANSGVLPQSILPNSAPVNEPSVASPQQANAPVVAEPTAPQQQLNAPPVAQTPGSVNDVKATASRKHIETTTSAAESKRDQRSFIARVQAALRNADHAEPTEAPPRPSNANPIAAHPPPALDASAAVATKPAGGTDVRPGPGLEAAPIQPNPPGPIEIESRPIASVQSTPPPAPARETGVLSGLEEMLRHDPYAGSDDAPRPPMPVGQ